MLEPRGHRRGAARSAGRPGAPALVSVAPAAAVRQALNLMSTWGVSQIPVLENGQSVGGLIEGTLMTARARAAGAARPPGARGDGSAVPGGGGHLPDRSAGSDAHPGKPGGAGARGREAHRDREPVRRAAAADQGHEITAGRLPLHFPDEFMRVTVLTGGTSAERDVAIASAVQVIAALRSGGHDVAVVDTARGYIPRADEASLLSSRWARRRRRSTELHVLEQGSCCRAWRNLAVVRDADVLFLALHGGRGEDGTLQTLLEMVGSLHRQRTAGERHGDGQGCVKAPLPDGGGADGRLGDGPRRRRPGRARLWVAGGGEAVQTGLHRRVDAWSKRPGRMTRPWHWPAVTTTRS